MQSSNLQRVGSTFNGRNVEKINGEAEKLSREPENGPHRTVPTALMVGLACNRAFGMTQSYCWRDL
jgi:hypothetical protein